MPTPLYDQLTALAQEHPLRLDMPGHHGTPLPGLPGWPSAIDFTENGRTGDLLGGEGEAIQQAQDLWARRVGLDSCLFLTGGSTQGIHAGLALLAGLEGEVAVDRGSHRSVYHALALLGLTPHYLPRPWLEQAGVTGPIQPETLENTLSQHPKIKTVCITSPTYYGVLSDLPALAQVCRRHGAKLMVDGAHGAHLPFLGLGGYEAADVVVMSAHKTLPAPGQTALLLARGYGQQELCRVGAIYGSSSPSYVMMAALDLVGDYLDGPGREAYTKTAALVENLRRRFPSLIPAPGVALDPTRLVLRCGDGHRMAEELRNRGIYPEMSDSGHVVFIFTCADGPEEGDRLARAWEALGGGGPVEWAPVPPPPSPPEMVMSPRQALFAPREEVAVEDSLGRVCAGQVAPYPPGIPVIAPGERVEKKYLAYLKQIGYNNRTIQAVLRKPDRPDGTSCGG